MYWAARYSFLFCMRNAKKETYARLFFGANNTLLLYLGIVSVGLIVTRIQEILPMYKDTPPTFGEFLTGEMAWPITFFLLVLAYGLILGRFTWYFQSKWNVILNQAERIENSEFRSKKDVAIVRSKKFDDLTKQIEELPFSWQTRKMFSDQMIQLYTILFSFVLFGASLVWYKPLYALIILISALPMMFVEFQMTGQWWALFEKLVPNNKKRYVLEKAFKNATSFVQTLMFNQSNELLKRIESSSAEVTEAYDEIRRMNVRREFPVHLISNIGLGVVIINTVYSVFHGLGIGTMTVIIAAARTFQGNLGSIVELVAAQWNSAKGVILIEKEFAGMEPLVKTLDPIEPNFDRAPTIRFDRVWFRYPDTEIDVLKDVSFTIESGTKVAIVGRSGHGKSTIQALLTRHYDPTQGAIYAEDINLKNITPENWNEWISALTQDYAISERQIAEEIASSRLHQPVETSMVHEASRFSHFEEVVKNDPLKYDTQIGTDYGGREFSGGERQRLALARVRYRNTPILILDEPDARLDPESAQIVMDNIFALKGITVILITHHVSRAERCGKIIVMNEGSVAEQGTHEELMSKNGTYSKMFDSDKRRLSMHTVGE